MTIYNLPPLMGAIANLFLGVIVYAKNRENAANRLFLFLSVCCAYWNFGVFILFSDLPGESALLWARSVHIAVIWAPVFFLNLIFIILSIKKRFILNVIYLLASILTFLSMTNVFINAVYKISYTSTVAAFYSKGGPFYPFFIVYLTCLLMYEAVLLWQASKRTSGLKQTQIQYLLIGLIISMIGGLNDILPNIGVDKYPLINVHVYTFGSVTIIFWTLIVAYAIIKHHLMDIDIVIKKGLVYSYLSFSVLVPCIATIIFAQYFFFGQTNTFFTLLAFSTLLLASLVILKVKPEIEEYIEQRLFKRKYEYKKALSELSEIVISFLDEKELFKKAGNILIKDLGTERVSFFMLDKAKRAYTMRASQKLGKSTIKALPDKDVLLQWLREKNQPIVKEVLERSRDNPDIYRIVERLDSMESEVCIPFMTRTELIGILNLGQKKSGDMYSHEDLDLLAQFATQASIALENARLYQEMQQTQMLMRRTDRLASLGSLTANLAHEIRNPLVTLKTFLDLFPKRYRDKEFRGEFLKLTSSELDRINSLVTDLLSFARPSKPDIKKGDINQVVEEVINLVTVEANKHDITINTNLQAIRQAQLDADQIKQVFLNIFLNAFEAIKKNGMISVTSREIKKNGKAYVQVEISNSGKAIPENMLEHIFDPFFTTKKKGGGLGLSISYQIVQEHHGTIKVESGAKKGTTFIVTIPCKT